MPVHTIAYVDWAFEVQSFELDSYEEDHNEYLEEEDDALVSSTWIENLKGLKLTAGAVLSDTRRLQFAFFDCFPADSAQNADLELAVRCPGVQELQLSSHDNKLCSVNDNYTITPRPAQEMWDYYKMDRLLDFGVRFKRVTILRKGHGNRSADCAALELARFVMLKFREKKGRRVEARVSGNKFVQSLGG